MLSSLVTRRVRPLHVVVAAVVYAPLAVVMFLWPGLVPSVSRTCGLPAFDVRAFWDADDARTMVNACGSAGRAAYIRLEIGDLFYPAALGVLLLVASALLLRRFGGRFWPVLLLIIGMTVLDYLENAGIWVLLTTWPDVNTAVADVAGIVTAVKRVLGFVSFGIPVTLLAIEIVHRGCQRLHRQRAGG